MLDWIRHSHDAFLTTYVEIGQSFQVAKRLKSDHEQFTVNLMVKIHKPKAQSLIPFSKKPLSYNKNIVIKRLLKTEDLLCFSLFLRICRMVVLV